MSLRRSVPLASSQMERPFGSKLDSPRERIVHLAMNSHSNPGHVPSSTPPLRPPCSATLTSSINRSLEQALPQHERRLTCANVTVHIGVGRPGGGSLVPKAVLGAFIRSMEERGVMVTQGCSYEALGQRSLVEPLGQKCLEECESREE